MKVFLLPMSGLLFAMATQAVANDAPSELHAAVTDIPIIDDMSHADPLTWHSAPGAVEVDVRSPRNGSPCLMLRIGLEVGTPMIIATR
jgi:hypothetical protein